MRFRKKIAVNIFPILFLFVFMFGLFVYAGTVALRLEGLRAQALRLRGDMHELYAEVRSVLTTVEVPTEMLRAALVDSTRQFERSLESLAGAGGTLRNPEIDATISSTLKLWSWNRRHLHAAIELLDVLIQSGIDERAGIYANKLYYHYTMPQDRLHDNLDHFHLTNLSNHVESFVASAHSFNATIARLAGQIERGVDRFIRLSVIMAGIILLIVVSGVTGFYFLYGKQALVGQIQRLLDEAVRKEQEKREAQLSALRHQINPHFLYNTLGSIRMMAVREHDPQTAQMLKILSRFLRNTVSRSQSTVPVGKDIRNLMDYITILQIRYNNRINVTVSVDPAVESCLVPTLLLQPIVENAVLHGLCDRLNRENGEATLRISGFQINGTLRFEVHDNGCGMDPETLHGLLRREQTPTLGESHRIGLKNIHERIQLKFGGHFGIQVASRERRFTKVMITLPYLRGGDLA